MRFKCLHFLFRSWLSILGQAWKFRNHSGKICRCGDQFIKILYAVVVLFGAATCVMSRQARFIDDPLHDVGKVARERMDRPPVAQGRSPPLNHFDKRFNGFGGPSRNPFDPRGRLHDFPHRLVGRSSLTDDPRPTGGSDSSGRHVDHTLKRNFIAGVGQQPQITNCISNFFSFEERGPLGHDVRDAFAAKYFFKNPRQGVHPVQHRHL